MKHSMSQRVYLGWQTYWRCEPWGSWRDNLHVAILAREIRRPQLRKGVRIDMNDFMVRSPAERKAEAASNLLTFLKSVAKKVTRD